MKEHRAEKFGLRGGLRCAACDETWPCEVSQLREALTTIVANTEPDAIKHRDYDHLAKDINDCAKSALGI